MKRILIFDTETTGFIDKNKPLDDRDQPRILQLAYILALEDGRIIGERNMLFSPLLHPDENYEIPPDAVAVHGIDTKFAVENGWKQSYAPSIFNNIAKKADLVVSHNTKYDIGLMKTAYARFLNPDDLKTLSNKEIYCTMNESSDFVKIPPTERMKKYGIKGYKSPSLSEAYQHFFEEELEGAHNAIVDAKACARIFFHMKELDRDHDMSSPSPEM